MAHLSFLFTHWWDDSTFDWEYNTDYPKSFKVGSIIYRAYNMAEVSYQSTQGIQYGVSDHVLGLIYIILRDRSKFNDPVISSINLSSIGYNLGDIALNGFTTKVVPNSENEGTILSIIDITPIKLNEIIAKINSARDASTTGGINISIFIKTTGTQENLVIIINVI